MHMGLFGALNRMKAFRKPYSIEMETIFVLLFCFFLESAFKKYQIGDHTIRGPRGKHYVR